MKGNTKNLYLKLQMLPLVENFEVMTDIEIEDQEKSFKYFKLIKEHVKPKKRRTTM